MGYYYIDDPDGAYSLKLLKDYLKETTGLSVTLRKSGKTIILENLQNLNDTGSHLRLRQYPPVII